jgi:hypothetical protein
LGRPFVRAALLCERVLRETDGVLSAIRFVHEGSTIDLGDPPIRAALLVMLVRGEAPPGTHRALLRILAPEQRMLSAKEIEITFDESGPEQISSLMLDLSFEPHRPGLYWFQVLWGGRLLTQMPFTAHPAGADRARAAH